MYTAPAMETPIERLKALADPVRLRLLQVLHDRGETCVCELVAELGTTQPNISTHLRLLRAAGLVDSHKVGKWPSTASTSRPWMHSWRTWRRRCAVNRSG